MFSSVLCGGVEQRGIAPPLRWLACVTGRVEGRGKAPPLPSSCAASPAAVERLAGEGRQPPWPACGLPRASQAHAEAAGSAPGWLASTGPHSAAGAGSPSCLHLPHLCRLPAHPHCARCPLRCQAEELIMIGDRYLTDVVFGNRNGMLTIRPEPFTSAGEPKAVLLVRLWGDGIPGWYCCEAVRGAQGGAAGEAAGKAGAPDAGPVGD